LYTDVFLEDKVLYSCPERRPRHHSIIVDHHDYRKEYPLLVGGVIVFLHENFKKVNGYPNLYWGWGAEDDSMYYRLKETGLGFDRPKDSVNYTMLHHEKRWKNPKRVKLLKENRKNYPEDGLNNVKYELNRIENFTMHTHIYIDVGIPPPELLGE
jgi:hypothetical protein